MLAALSARAGAGFGPATSVTGGTGGNGCGCRSEVPGPTINDDLAATLVAGVTISVTPEVAPAVGSTGIHLESPK